MSLAQNNNEYVGWVTAMSHALERGDDVAFRAALAGFDGARNNEVTTGIRKIAADLQTALDQFRIDSKLIDLAQRQVPDARHRLAHVLRLTDDAAHRTMDLVDRCCPIADQVAQQAERLAKLQDSAGSGWQFQTQLSAFLQQASSGMSAVRENLREVLLAQGYQDLTGQIIRGVMTLVDELEAALGELVRIGGNPLEAKSRSESTHRGHGPVIPGVNHGNAVSGQQDIDALLSDLGV